MIQFIKRFNAVGLHGRFDLDIDFTDGVNIVHGVNGAGKTTLLHVLTNAANLELLRFTYLTFQSIRLEISNDRVIEFVAEPVKSDDHVSNVTLMIDGNEVAAWPPLDNDVTQDAQQFFSVEQPHPVAVAKDANQIDIHATYFPAFRTMIEAWSSIDRSDSVLQHILEPRHRGPRRVTTRRRLRPSYAPTELARKVFGNFVPSINYPSPREIERQLDHAIQRAVNRLATEDRSLLSNAFTGVFGAISQESGLDRQDDRTAEAIRANISEQLQQLQSAQSEYGLPVSHSAFDVLESQLASSQLLGGDQDETTIRILRVYEEALNQRAKILTDAFIDVRHYIDSVNNFLDGKQLVTVAQDVEATPRLQISHDDDSLSPLDTLSSGERQIAGLIYAASHVTQSNVILVDEPELSLHIDWQRKIIGAMVQQFPSKQLIVCTHSPVISAKYKDKMIELTPQSNAWYPEVDIDDNYDDLIWSDALDFEDFEDIT